jgi:hypothetical protein
MSRKTLERVALGYCTVVLLGAAWYWSRQIESVIELLRLAYG